MLNELDLSFINDLDSLKAFSDDPDTQTTCIIVNEIGFNVYESNRFAIAKLGFQSPSKECPERSQRPLKYSFIGHAEALAIAKAARLGTSTDGATLYLNWFPCDQCSISIVHSGIKRVVCNKKAYEDRKDDPKYKFSESMSTLVENDIKIDWYEEIASRAA